MEKPTVARLVRRESLTRPAETAERFVANIETVVHDKRAEIQLVLAAMFAGGHVLFEDVPGTAKTVLARAIAQSIDGATTTRIQCTPDLQPADVTGMSVFNQKDRDFVPLSVKWCKLESGKPDTEGRPTQNHHNAPHGPGR